MARRCFTPKPEKWFLAPTEKPPKPEDEKELNLDALEIYANPKEEWAQMYHEVWRLFRDYFYDPGYHGLDINAAEKALRTIFAESRKPCRFELFDE